MRRATAKLLAVLLDVVFVNAAYLIGLLLVFRGDLPEAELRNYFDIAIFITLLQAAALYWVDAYDRNFFLAGLNDFLAVAKGAALGSVLVIAATFYNRTFAFSRLGFAYAFVFAIILTVGWRFLLRLSVELGWRRHLPRRRAVIIGDGPEVARLAQRLNRDPRYGYEILGGLGIAAPESLGRYSDLCAVFNQRRFDEALIVAKGAPTGELLKIFEMLVELDLPCRVLPGLYELLLAESPVGQLGEIPLLELALRRPRTRTEAAKRAFDLALGVPAAILTLPLLIALALAVRGSSPGPACFNRQRVGRRGKEFYMFKLRTMVWEPTRPLDLTHSGDDPRITPLGRFLRRWSLDELPQVWNVVRGEMSLVGPRPEIPAVVAEYSQWQHAVLAVKPGITGLAQVSGRDELSIPEKLHLDIYYCQHHTLALDLKILIKTVWVVLSGEGVN